MRLTSARSTKLTRRQILSRRKLLLETLESRQLLAVDGLGLAGDSLTDEYFNASYGGYAKNWATLVGEYRSDFAPLGELRTPPEDWGAGDIRRSGYEYNWAVSGANSFSLLTQQQHASLATDINQGDVSHAVLAIGQNDFSPGTAAYSGIYDGTWTAQQISDHSDDVFNNVKAAIETIDINGVRLVVSNIIDYGVAPATQGAFPNEVQRDNVTAVIDAINDRLEQFAIGRGVPVIDSFNFVADVLGPSSFQFGGVQIDNEPGTEPDNVFVADGVHPHTVSSSIIANAYLNAFNVAYGEDLPLFTEAEVLDIVGLPYVQDTFGVNYSDYLVLPERTTGLFLNEPAASDGFTLLAPNTATTTYLIDREGTVVNEWDSAYTAGLLGYLQPDGSLIRAGAVNADTLINAVGGGGIIEQFDWDGNKIWEFEYGANTDDPVLQHHDIEVLPNGNILLIAWEAKTEEEATEAGRDPNLPGNGELFPDHIVEVEPDYLNGGGTIVWQWHVWDHLVQEFDDTKQNYVSDVADFPGRIDLNYVSTDQFEGGQAEDWTHANGIDYNEELGQILLSVREFSEIWVIDHNTTTEEAAGPLGDLLYRWGNPQAYDRGDESDRVLYFQHDAKWVEDGKTGAGNITLFNNGYGRPGTDLSSVEEIDPPEFNGVYTLEGNGAYGPAVTNVWTYTGAEADFSPIISGTERLANGNTRITYGVNGTIVEVTPSGEEVWRYVNPYTQGGMLGPFDAIPSLGIGTPGLDSLKQNFTFKSHHYPADFLLPTPTPPAVPPELQLHSNPNSDFTIFLDFNGNVTYGTPWNDGRDDVLVNQPANISLSRIEAIWQQTAEDFAPFDVNVTTEEPGSEALRRDGPDDTEWGVRVVITPNDIYDLCFDTCGGIAHLNSFDAAIDDPVYTFSTNAFNAASINSHEVGHSLGLSHHGANSDEDEYYDGHDSGLGYIWMPIMGFGYQTLSQWSDGGYFGASNSGQDDLSVITTQNGFGYRADDHQDDMEFATPLRITNSDQVSFSGIIERSDDIDYFTFEHGGGPLRLDIRPFEDRPNLDVWAGLYDEDGELIEQHLQVFDPSFPESPSPQVPLPSVGLSESFDLTLPAGIYFLKVDGVGSHAMYDADRDTVWDPAEIPALPPFGEDPEFGEPWTEDPAIGYSDYGSLGQYWITGTIVPPAINTINIEATDAIKPEGNTGDETSFVFTLTRTGPLDAATNVDYIVIPALPRAQGDIYPQTVNDEDFRSIGFPLGLPSGFASFEAGQATTEIAITVAGDTIFEPDEYFEVLLFAPLGESVPWTFENSSAIGVIQSDENQFYIQAPGVETVFQEEGDDLGSNVVGANYDFTVIRSGYAGAVDTEITVPWTIDSSAFVNSSIFSPATPADFVRQDGTRFRDAGDNLVFPFGELVFAPGETEKLVTIYARADRIFEMDDAFHLVLGNPEFTTTPNHDRPLTVHPDLGRSLGIIDNEDLVAAPTLSVEATISEVYENGEVLVAQQASDFAIATQVTITRDGDVSDNPVVVTVTLSPDSADQAFLMIGPPVGDIDPARDGLKTIDIPFDADQEFFDNLYLVSVDDDEVDGTQVVTLIANAENYTTGVGTALVYDDNTALDIYVAKVDDSYGFEPVSTIDAIGYTTYIVDLTSQTWLTTSEVDEPVWQHWVQIIVPDNAVSETAVLVISGGSRSDTAPTQPDEQALFFALQTNQVTVILPTVPNQPLIFTDDQNNPRTEDEIIAYSFDKYLDGVGDNVDEWPVLLPMVKSAVAAMDMAQEFLPTVPGPTIEDFFVTGASKRGWTTWLTAAVDDRVSGIAPAVIDVLNMGVSMNNHQENYEGVTERIVGGYAEKVQDYTEFGIFDRFNTPAGRATWQNRRSVSIP